MGKDMTGEKIKYTRVVGKARYFEPSRKLRALGFKPKKWPEDATGRKRAKEEVARAEHAVETNTKPTLQYPEGSLGHYWFRVYLPRQRKRLERGEIKPRTFEEFETAWVHIGNYLGSTLLNEITVDTVADFFHDLTTSHTPRVRKRCIGKLKHCLKHAVTDKLIPTNPAALQVNPGTAPRRATFTPDEMQLLTKGAYEQNMLSMALVIRLMYETARAPVDARLLNLDAIRVDELGPFIDRSREKTSVEGFQPISQGLYDDIMAYVGSLGVTLLPDAPIFRQHKRKRGYKTLRPWSDESDFAKDFAKVRKAVFGEDEKRMAMDIRRTANLEAKLGDATPDERAALLANSLNRNKELDNVYSPATLIDARKANDARQKGREMLRSASGGKKNG